MSALTIPTTQPAPTWVLPDRGKVAMAALIIAESAGQGETTSAGPTCTAQ